MTEARDKSEEARVARPRASHDGRGRPRPPQPPPTAFGVGWQRGTAAMVAPMPAEPYPGVYFSGQSRAPNLFSMSNDSIAAIWSRASPGGVPMPDSYSGSFVYNGSSTNGMPPTGQFAANLTGHFATTTELNLFRNQDFYPQQQQQPPYNYVQWPAENGGYVERGDVVASMENLRVSNPGSRAGGNFGNNGANERSSSGAPKKMSWANVASQPARPVAVVAAKAKKPGVLAPPTIISKASAKDEKGDEKSNFPDDFSAQSDSKLTDEGALFDGKSNPDASMAALEAQMNGEQMNEAGMGFARKGARPPPPFQSQGNDFNNLQQSGQRVPDDAYSLVPPNVFNEQFHPTHPVLEMLWAKNHYNPRSFELSTYNARYFVIKSFSEDDIHRSIKYEIWCSTDNGNRRLDRAFRERENKGPIYLFFSVNASGHFCGVAQMLSPVDHSAASSGIWVQDKFKGRFGVKWIYVKDVPNGQLRHIRLENNENKPVTNSRDTQEVPPRKGALVLKIIHGYKHQTSIFDDFAYYERRQEEELLMKKAAATNNQPGHHVRDFQSRRQNTNEPPRA